MTSFRKHTHALTHAADDLLTFICQNVGDHTYTSVGPNFDLDFDVGFDTEFMLDDVDDDAMANMAIMLKSGRCAAS
jgi:hypothetical protein